MRKNRRFEVVLIEFDDAGRPTLNAKSPVLETNDGMEAWSYAKSFNRGELADPIDCWAAVRVVKGDG